MDLKISSARLEKILDIYLSEYQIFIDTTILKLMPKTIKIILNKIIITIKSITKLSFIYRTKIIIIHNFLKTTIASTIIANVFINIVKAIKSTISK